MSHNVQITGIKIKDLDALDKAIAELRKEGVNVTLDRGTPGKREKHFRTYKGFGNVPYADHVIRIADASYDIGLLQQPGGHYEPIYDDTLDRAAGLGSNKPCPIACPWSPGDKAHSGHAMGKLMQRYTAVVAEKTARMRGYATRRVIANDGTIELLMTTA